MKKTIKYFITIMGIFIGILLCGVGTSNAYFLNNNFKVNKRYTVNGAVLRNCNNVLCVQHGASIVYGVNYNFYCQNKITIEGNTSKGKKGNNNSKEYTDTANGTIAYLLSSYRTQTGYRGAHAADSVQNDIWRYIATWKNEVGIKYDGLSNMIMTGAGLDNTTSTRINEAKNYAENVGKQTQLTDKTDKENIKVKLVQIDNEEYVRIGPFKWEFEGSFSSIKVKDSQDNNLKVKYVRYNSDKEPILGVDNIKSDKNFYILIEKNKYSNLNNSVKFEIVKAEEINKVTIWFLSSGQAQNLITYKNDTTTDKQTYNYEYNIEGNLKLIKVDEKNNTIKLENVGFYIQNKDIDKYIRKNDDGTIDYVSKEKATEFVTDANGEILIENLLVGQYVAYESKNPNYGYEVNLEGKEKAVAIDKTAELVITNEKLVLGEFILNKYDSLNNELKLENVEFTIQALDGIYANKYVNVVDGKITYQDEVCTLSTNKDGIISIKDMYLGKYHIKETYTPHEQYEAEYDQIIDIQKTETDSYTVNVPNVQKYIKLSGYVWEDIMFGKEKNYNYLYNEGTLDDSDRRMEGITVRLKNKNGVVIQETKTGAKGVYKFDKVKIDELSNYYIEFEYDGLTYASVDAKTDKANGSKAEEYIGNDTSGRSTTNSRTLFNSQFGEITNANNGQTNQGFVRDSNGNVVSNLKYELTDKTATMTNTGKYTQYEDGEYKMIKVESNGEFIITANTLDTKTNSLTDLKTLYTPGMAEIENINLGLYKRIQPNLSVTNDLENIKLTINGYEHTYWYEQRSSYNTLLDLSTIKWDGDVGAYVVKNTATGEWVKYQDEWGNLLTDETAFNIGVRFQDKYNLTYKRAIYQSDVEYIADEKSKELNAYITYKTYVGNVTSIKADMASKVTELVNYYDSSYEIVSSSLLDIKGNKLKDINWKSNGKYGGSTYNGEYTASYTTDLSDNIINPQERLIISTTYKLDRQAVLDILNGNQTLDNIIEINSYTTISGDGLLYAGIDSNSAVGNAITGNTATYEDDTDAAPSLVLEVTDAREITGKVFEDSVTGEVKAGEVRQGSGAYEDGEKGIADVRVQLVERSGSAKVYEATTDAEGNYTIKGFIPGEYDVRYTWGDKTYKVQNYKGTVYDSNRDRTDMYWYKKDVDNRLTDAIDNYEIRQSVDIQTVDMDNNLLTKIDSAYEGNNEKVLVDGKEETIKTKMYSLTPKFTVGVEYETTTTSSLGDRYTYKIENIDFGIVERARQSIEISKRISNVKITLANGEVLLEGDPKNATIQNVKYLKPSQVNSVGQINITMDDDMIHGAILQVTYEFVIENKSELDYNSEKFYKFGIIEGEQVTLKPQTIIDYLDNNLAYSGNEWVVVEDKESLTQEGGMLSEELKEVVDSYNKILTTSTDSIKAGESITKTITLSRILTNSDELVYYNDAEILKVSKEAGSLIGTIPGNYKPGEVKEVDETRAEILTINSPTGEDRGYAEYIIVAGTMLGIIVAGIVIIKKKVISE